MLFRQIAVFPVCSVISFLFLLRPMLYSTVTRQPRGPDGTKGFAPRKITSSASPLLSSTSRYVHVPCYNLSNYFCDRQTDNYS